MDIEKIFFALILVGSIVSGILYVAFGQITVRKLRKNPKTKDQLGIEFASGWDIINVAQALAFPRSWSRKLENTPLSSLNANSKILFENTSKFDRCLGAIFYWLFITSAVSGALLVLLNSLGIFGE